MPPPNRDHFELAQFSRFSKQRLDRVRGRLIRYPRQFIASGIQHERSSVIPARSRHQLIRQAGAYVTQNAPGMAYQTMSIADLQKRIGIDVFPQLPATLKAAKMHLPIPEPHGHRSKKNRPIEINPT